MGGSLRAAFPFGDKWTRTCQNVHNCKSLYFRPSEPGSKKTGPACGALHHRLLISTLAPSVFSCQASGAAGRGPRPAEAPTSPAGRLANLCFAIDVTANVRCSESDRAPVRPVVRWTDVFRNWAVLLFSLEGRAFSGRWETNAGRRDGTEGQRRHKG
jgi:hypothetical protein